MIAVISGSTPEAGVQKGRPVWTTFFVGENRATKAADNEKVLIWKMFYAKNIARIKLFD